MSEDTAPPDEEYGETEVFVRDGGAWFPNAFALCKRLGLEYLSHYNGSIYAGLPGRGECKLSDVLAAEGKPNLRPIK